MAKKRVDPAPDAHVPKLRVVPLSTLKPDPQNINRHTQRGQGVVERSMSQRGFARPGFAAKDGTILGGNLSVVEVAADLGMQEAIVVETDGTRPVVHVRTDLEPGSDEARLLAIEDNQSAAVSLDWDPAGLLNAAGTIDLTHLFTPDELMMHTSTIPEAPTLNELTDQYGEAGERDLWPEIKVQVPQATFERYRTLMALAPGEDDGIKFGALIGAVDADIWRRGNRGNLGNVGEELESSYETDASGS